MLTFGSAICSVVLGDCVFDGVLEDVVGIVILVTLT